MFGIDVGDATSFELSIQAHPTKYILSLTRSGHTDAFTVSVADMTMSPPIGGSFTGTMFGIYSFGNGEPVLDPADFSDIGINDGTNDRI